MAHREFRYIAIVPLDCGVDNEVVHYAPGDDIPSEVLGRAIGPLLLADKIARIVINVDDEDGPAVVPEPEPVERVEDLADFAGGTTAEVAAHAAQLEREAEDSDDDEGDGVLYPSHLGGGLYRLSDGSTVKGKGRAEAAEAELS